MWVDTMTPYPLAFAGFLLPPPPSKKKKKVPASPALVPCCPQVRMRRSPTLERPIVFQ